MSTCAVKYEILVWVGVSLSEPSILLFYSLLCYVTLHYGVLLVYVTVVLLLFVMSTCAVKYEILGWADVPLSDRLWNSDSKNLDMLTCAVKYEILVWAGVSLSEPSILLFYSLLCYVTLHCGVLLVYVTVVLRFFVMSTCAVKYEISSRVEEGRLWNSGSKFGHVNLCS